MRRVLLAVAAVALVGGAAQAKDAPNGVRKELVSQQQTTFKVLYVCSEDEQALSKTNREPGAPEFVTADQVRAEQGKPWSAPKCITPAEARRLNVTNLRPVR